MRAEIGALWKILTQQSVGVLVGAALPWAVRIAEIDLDASIDLQACVLSHLSSLIPGQRSTQLLRQGDNRLCNGVAHRLCTMSSERGSVLHAGLVAMVRHAWQVQQQREARHTFNQGADRGTANTQDEVAFPVARYGPINCLRWTLADHDLGRDEGLAPPARTRSRCPQCPPSTQASCQLAAQRATALHEQRLIDGFMADAHGLIVREVDRQAASNLLRAPGVCPPPMLPRSVPAAFPVHSRARSRSTTRSDDEPSQPLLHIGSQCRVERKLRRLWAACRSLGMPLRCRRAILQIAASGRGVAPQLPRDR